MKLTKVEIQAFRIYEKLDEGTFDLRSENGKTADFVSIYAPNGFGKTSFYDAIEWAFTSRVDRIARQNKFVNRDKVLGHSPNTNTNPGRSILRNKYAATNSKTFVRVSLENDPAILRELAKPRAGSHDLNSGISNEVIVEDFGKMLLEQDAIDAFLRSEDSEERYAEWAKHFGDNEVEPYYKTLLSLSSVNSELIYELNREVASLAASGFKQDITKLDPLNLELSRYRSYGRQFPVIDESFDDEKWVALLSELDTEKVDKEASVRKASQQLIDLDTARTGSAGIPGVREFLGIPARIASSAEEISQAETQLSLHKEIESTGERKRQLDEEKAGLKEYASGLAKIAALMPRASKTRISIKQMERSLSKAKGDRRRLSAELKDSESSRAAIEAMIAASQIKTSALTGQLNAIPTAVSEVDKLSSEIKEIVKKRSALAERAKLISGQELKASRNDLSRIERILAAIEGENFKGINLEPIDSELTVLVTDIQKRSKDTAALKKRLASVSKSIQSNTQLRSDLEQLLVLGQTIVRGSEEPTCPLCQHTYPDRSTLLDRIVSNRSLSLRTKEITDQRDDIEASIKANDLARNQLIGQLTNALNTKCDELRTLTSSREMELDALTVNLLALNDDISSLEVRIAAHATLFVGLTPAKFVAKAKRELDEAEMNLKVLNSNLQKAKTKEERLERKIISVDADIKQLTGQLERLENDRAYVKFLEFLQDHELDEGLTNIGLRKLVGAAQADLDRVLVDSEKLIKSIKATRLNVAGTTVPTLEALVSEKRDSIAAFKAKEETYRLFLENQLNIDLEKVQNAETAIKNETKLCRREIDDLRSALDALRKIDSMRNSVRPFLKYWSDQSRLRKLGLDLDHKLQMASAYDGEKKRVAEIMTNSIKAFFNEELINRFYRAIDPHPVYDSVKFDCRFDEKQPTLDILVRKGNGEEAIVPNLYFSAAQINVLSLSIFLARSLKATDREGNPLECIFIDDPIQSMDSINILSTIDLLRSIVVNLNKQVILSTHDENFHRLLQKKIPPTRFRSKFLELETYGKVKVLPTAEIPPANGNTPVRDDPSDEMRPGR